MSLPSLARTLSSMQSLRLRRLSHAICGSQILVSPAYRRLHDKVLRSLLRGKFGKSMGIAGSEWLSRAVRAAGTESTVLTEGVLPASSSPSLPFVPL